MGKFKASFSKGMCVATVFFTLVLLYASYSMLYQMSTTHMDSCYFLTEACAVCIVLGVWVYAYFSQLTYIDISQDALVLKRKVGKITIPCRSIKQVQPKKSIMYDIRLWGISGCSDI